MGAAAWPACSGLTIRRWTGTSAVKVLPSYYTGDPTFVQRFAQEAQTVARLSHPNILQIYDFGEDKGFTYLVSELIAGGTLQDKMGPEPMRLEDGLKYIGPLAEGLDYAHGQGIVHRTSSRQRPDR